MRKLFLVLGILSILAVIAWALFWFLFGQLDPPGTGTATHTPYKQPTATATLKKTLTPTATDEPTQTQTQTASPTSTATMRPTDTPGPTATDAPPKATETKTPTQHVRSGCVARHYKHNVYHECIIR